MVSWWISDSLVELLPSESQIQIQFFWSVPNMPLTYPFEGGTQNSRKPIAHRQDATKLTLKRPLRSFAVLMFSLPK